LLDQEAWADPIVGPIFKDQVDEDCQISELEPIDLFIHDSLNSERNVRFEMDLAWAKLRPGGAIIVDDVDVNWGFHTFNESFPGYFCLVCEAEPISPDHPRFNEKGLFGIVIKPPSI
jgi:hypothetical protein